MQLVQSISLMQRRARLWAQAGIGVGLVPTMGYLHEGHLSLVRRARGALGTKGKVVVSIYVNPTQFSPTEDFSRYPRDLKRDMKLCRDAGVDAVFAPRDQEMYPNQPCGAFSTYVAEEMLSKGMEGSSRPTHFRGVTTVVAKLFNIVQPRVAVFGAKDFQQAAIVRRMVRDLNFPLKIIVAPTYREPDGLAMSSRNRYLRGDLRQQALALWHAIKRARAVTAQNSKPVPASRLKAQLKTMIESQPSARLDYVEFFEPETLNRSEKVTRGTHMALAVFVGKTRLIDNGRL